MNLHLIEDREEAAQSNQEEDQNCPATHELRNLNLSCNLNPTMMVKIKR